MKQWRRKKIIQSAIGIVVCISMLVESSPLLAMSYAQSQSYPSPPPSTFLPTYLKAFFALEPADAAPHPASTVPSSLPTPPPPAAATPSASLAPAAAAGVPGKFTAAFNKPHLQSPSLAEIPLLPDWNLVSLPTEQVDTDPTAVLAGIAGDYTTVFAYDGCNPADPWQIYDPAAPPVTNDLTAVDHTIGFWIQATTATAVPVSGSVPPTTTMQLCTGWNLIGMPTEQARPVRNALFSIEGKYTLVFGYNPADTEDPWELYDVNAPAWANDLQMMQPGRGYWVLATEDTTLTLANEGGPPIARLISPDELATEITTITFITDVIGTAYSDILESWTLSYRPKGESTWAPFATGTSPVLAHSLAQFDPSLLFNGLYEIELSVTDYDNNITLSHAAVMVDGRAKIGNFTISVVDIELPVAGIPIQVIRTYDSRDKLPGDFGVGWRLSLSNIMLEESTTPGLSWLGRTSGGGFPSYCISASEAHQISITMPDETILRFEQIINPTCQPLVPPQVVNVTYRALPGTQGILVPLDQDTQTLVVGGFPAPFGDPRSIELWDISTTSIYDPDSYKLSMPDGREFIIDQADGLQRITDLNGNILTFTEDGIAHSSGKDISFLRDEQDRIVQITDPMSNAINYIYDGNGDLVAVTDQIGHTAQFTYDDDHYLLDYIDPRGVVSSRNEYDDSGRLVAIVDAEGNRIEFTHNLDTNQEVTRDRLGNITIYEYDQQGNIVSQTDALGNSVTSIYDDRDNLLSQTDPLGNTISYSYDSRDNLLTETDPLGNTTTYTYNDRNQVTTVTDPLGNVINNTYDAQGNLFLITDASGNTITNTYNNKGNVTLITNSLGHATTFNYSGSGALIQQINSLGNVINYTYDANNNLISESRTRTDDTGILVSVTTTNIYDSQNRLTQSIDANGNSAFIEYNLIGRRSATVDKNGNRTEFEYDLLGNLVKTIYADGTVETSTYDANRNLLSKTNRSGHTTQYEYDSLNRLKSTTFADGSTVSNQYDAAGRLISITDENGNTTTYEYNEAGKNTKVIDALGNETTFTYNYTTLAESDEENDLASFTDANSHTTSFEYDASNRRTRTIFPDGTFNRVIYDTLGQKISELDQADQATQFEYDALGRLTKVIDALGNETIFTYDEVGNKLTQTDANGHTTGWAYDNHGRVISHTLPLGMVETFTYDANDNILTHTDFSGQAITYTYDANNRLIAKTYPDNTQTQFAYTATGKRATITDTHGVTTYSYDERDRLLSIVNSNGTFLNYSYDSVGNRTSVTTPSGTISYTYDALNRLTAVIDPDGGVANYAYDSVGNRATLTAVNGTITNYTYDDLNRLVFLENKKSTGDIISSYTYVLGTAGNRLSVVENSGRSVAYTYDATYKLVEEIITDPVLGDETIAYDYDFAGNRLIKTDATGITTYTYDANDRLLTENSNTYSYDNNGNTVSQVSGTEVTTYTYDAENQLVSAQTPSATIGYSYDHDGIKISTTVNGVITNLLVDKNRDFAQVLEERDSTSGLLVSYVYGDELLSQKRGGFTSYYHHDGLGSTRALSDNGENITDTYVYEAFGNLLASTGSTANNFLFTGEQFDPNAGFYYLRARHYAPEIGRFTSADSFPGFIFEPITLHKYLYANADPVNRVDPSGNFSSLTSITITSAIIGILAGIVTYAVTGSLQTAVIVAVGAFLVSFMALGGAGLLLNSTAATTAASGGAAVPVAGNLLRPGTWQQAEILLERVFARLSFPVLTQVRIFVNGRVRIPDFWSANFIADSKFVQYLASSPQIRDFVTYAINTGRPLYIYVRLNTYVTPQVLQQVRSTGGEVIRITH